MKNVAVIGYGVVGSGTVELFEKNRDSINAKVGRDCDIKYIVDLRDFPDSPFADKMVKDFNTVLEDDEIEVVAEVIGGINPAYTFTKQALERGKSVVTSNKELVANKGAELLKIAHEHNCNYLFEASVGGGIPIIRPLNKCLAGNTIEQISGILNGTTNFILTKMIKEQLDFETALKMAQDLGYAEKDPTADVEGHDACRKICILGSLAYGKHIYPQNVHCSGISKITLDDVAYAENAGFAIKLIGSVKPAGDGKVSAIVCPRLVSKSNLLATVDGVYNAISVTGDGVGDVLFYGHVSTSTLISHKTYNYCSTILTFYIGLILLFLDMKLPSYRTFIFHCPIMRVVYQVEHILFYLLFLSDRYSFNHTAISPFSRLPQ